MITRSVDRCQVQAHPKHSCAIGYNHCQRHRPQTHDVVLAVPIRVATLREKVLWTGTRLWTLSVLPLGQRNSHRSWLF